MDRSDNPFETQAIGLLGGSFDPIHMGHIKMALAAIEEFNLDKVFFITAKSSPFKLETKILNAEQRYQLVQQALSGYKNLISSRIELDREGEVSYSSDTIREFKNLFPQARLFWIIGEDAFCHLKEWKNYQWIIENIEFLLFSRNLKIQETTQNKKDIARFFLIDSFTENISSSELRKSIQENRLIGDTLLPYVCPGTVDLLLEYYRD
jgi:nicotinate-nucleotide adenylyltransferase